MKVLVMGGSSFVSQLIAMKGIELGYQVDIFTRGRTPIPYEGYHHHFVGDRKRVEDLQQLRTPYDYVMDITAYDEEDVSLLVESLDLSKVKRYVMCSTASVYIGFRPGLVIKEDHPRGKEEAFDNTYGYNKYLAEEYLFNHPLPVTIFRPTYIYGEYNNIYRDAYLFESIQKGRILCLEDKCHVQFVYGPDLASTFYSALDNDKAINKAYNMAHTERLTWTQWLEAGMKAVGKEALVDRVTEEEAFSNGQKFPFTNMDLCFDTSALEEDGLLVPAIRFQEGIKRAYAWYQTVGLTAVTKRRFDLDT